ncbi:zinc-binding alcohol dehydrogenase [Wenjunlia vitaminophila]|uniref:2-deoxy-scyllo-inosamine dehydrogenase n=1 Tax=Wenjunlia vitaminophila TaxID=76728 RepID=A0A0T6LWS5_WENVI|nr:alcohol dehydrogenase catalytic domain-containing protein [Wenjunlia vitaminophila]KRV50509.1 zinc-binding alcohol dehydrogenase [Wenjunlia vitaminophila]
MSSLALEYHRSPGRFLAARGLSRTRSRVGGTLAGALAPLRLVRNGDPELPKGDGWTRVSPTLSGICGSDLGLLHGTASPYLGPLTSPPFVLGHEVVGTTLDDLPGIAKGTRVVLDSVLSCRVRGLPPCESCQEGQTNRCDHITSGHLAPGLQTGFCADTGGGWSQRMVAHEEQLHPIPDSLSDQRAVLVEPLACAIHSVRRVPIPPGASVLVVGAGTVGLFTVLALRQLTEAGSIHVVAKYRHQQEKARQLGATEVVEPGRALRAVRRMTSALAHRPEIGSEFLLGGADFAFECTGGSSGLDTALRSVRAGGTVLLSGMPTAGADLTPLWFRELNLVGAYATRQREPGGPEEDTSSDFAKAVALAASAPLDGYVERYPLHHWRQALEHASSAGSAGSIKIAFDLSLEG